jgi:hypothetical protein
MRQVGHWHVGAFSRARAEVEDLHDAVRRDLDVGGLQIAMDDASLVRGIERIGDLARDGQRVGNS